MLYPLFMASERPTLSKETIDNHIAFLKEKFYQVETKWPQFKLMFETVEGLNQTIAAGAKILVLERAYFYGGYSLFAPLFPRQSVIAVDCYVGEMGDRFGQQESWLQDERCIKWRPNHVNSISDLKDIESGSIDVVFVPNVVHHEKQQDRMFEEFARVLRKGGQCVVFEGLVRELHHLPEDYIRYTPEGFRAMFEKVGFTYEDSKFGSGVFDVIAYVWQNAFEYLPQELRVERMKWFYEEHFPYLQELDAKYPRNIVKPDKAFPMSYVVTAHK